MGYFSNLLRAAIGKPSAQTFDLQNMSPENIRDFLRVGGGGYETASGVSVTESSALRVAAAWRCVNIISGTVGTLPLDLIRRVSETERQPATGHPLRKVLTVKPNHWQTPSEFRRMMQAHLLLRGNAYALKVMVGGQVAALVPIHPDRVEVEQSNDLTLIYRISLKSGQFKILSSKDVLHLRGMSLDGVKGLSVLGHMRESIGLSLTMERHGATVFKNGAMPSTVLKHPNKLGKEGVEFLRASLDAYRQGGDSEGKALILEEGMDIAPMSMTSEDAQWIESRKFSRSDIAMFFGVPPHMIGDTEKSTSWGTGIEAQGIGFVTYTLNDWLKIWEEAIKRDLLIEREWETIDIRFFTQGLMRGDAKTRWETYTKARQWGIMNADEIRALEDMNPRADGRGGEYAEPPNTAGGEQIEEEGNPND
jgi:HK97 family phage portal protein